MSKRICNRCGKNREVRYGKHCEKGHFICGVCDFKNNCPICEKKLFGAFPRRDVAAKYAMTNVGTVGKIEQLLTDREQPLDLKAIYEHEPRIERSFMSNVASFIGGDDSISFYSRGVSAQRFINVARRAGFNPQKVEGDESLITMECSLFESGEGTFFVILSKTVPERGDECHSCGFYIWLKSNITQSTKNEINKKPYTTKAYDAKNSTGFMYQFLLFGVSDDGIEANLQNWFYETNKILEEYI